MMQKHDAEQGMVLIGFGGHAKSMADSVEAMGAYHIVGYTAPCPNLKAPYPYLGTDDALEESHTFGTVFAAIGVGYMGRGHVRDDLVHRARAIGYSFPVIADPAAVVSCKSTVGEGSFLGKGSVLNVGVSVGEMCIVNTGAILEHDVRVGNFTHVAGGAVVCGDVTIADHVLIGANATVIQGICVGSHAVIGAGSVVLRDVPAGRTVCGVWKGDADGRETVG